MSQDPPRERRRTDRRVAGRAEVGRDLVPVTLVETVEAGDPASPAPDPAQPDPAFAAQMMGQSDQKRGLKGGQPVLEAARTAYLETEHSGERDRRPPIGQKSRTEI
ncbi:hypothetical protein [Brevundimonas sp.]|uniref:hypothetical protein n=1 Tax=Brevundimonas sp. TaxID=1871086 RepID=UPI0025C341D6|nr:hypothetical protein [Brevundimonas sp.]